ncbi:MAG: PIG-L family deacetylase [Candidatus Nanoarchaeia archaeon]|nr:PIG-L family deacetylase [Candidatus Nanoarchaeia archaeon]
MPKERTILIFCAHSDDEAVGMGGAIAKYAAEGVKVIKVVFSFGESSHPHFQEHIVINRRLEETEKASRSIGIAKTIFWGMRDTKVKDDAEKINAVNKIKQLLNEYVPERIFVTSSIDPHPDHQAVNRNVLKAIDSSRKKYAVYEFEVWNIIKENKPVMYVDITPYYKKKMQYIKQFSSQWQWLSALKIPVWLRTRYYGSKNSCKYAEKFYKVR